LLDKNATLISEASDKLDEWIQKNENVKPPIDDLVAPADVLATQCVA
jgi:hypothetical protein